MHVAPPRQIVGLAVCTIAFGVSAPARAAGDELARTEPAELAIAMGTSALLTGGALLLPYPEVCRWCEPPVIDVVLHAPVDVSSRRPVAFVSHLISFGVLPLGGVASVLLPPMLGVGEPRHMGENTAIMAEALLANVAITVAVKKWVGRQRPAFYFGRGDGTEFAASSTAPNLSFFSGDTSVAFVMASTASTVSFLRGYRSAPYVTAGGGALAVAVGLMRVGADVHWPTDVLAGAVFGTAVGVLVPVLVHPRAEREPVARVDQPARVAPLSAPLLQLGGRF